MFYTKDHMEGMSIQVWGQVQEVSFRYYARKEAKKLGLRGLARNEPDGSVYIEVEGPPENLAEFLEWCGTGSPKAKVEKIITLPHKTTGHEGFKTY